MSKLITDFREYRAKMNKKILASDNKVMKRIYSLDTLTYQTERWIRKPRKCSALFHQWYFAATTALNIILKNVTNWE